MNTAVILAAGLGSRLVEITGDKPKGFLEIKGKSLIERSLEKLFNAGIKNIFIGTGHLSEYYEALASKDSRIHCVKNKKFRNTGSMFTLYCMRDIVKDDFFLLESDLLYDKKGLIVLSNDPSRNVILSSSLTHSSDEVFIETDSDSTLVNMAKDKKILNSVDGELVGISKISHKALLKICAFAEKEFYRNPMMDYEYALVGISFIEKIMVRILDSYAWCEIDDANHLKRAIEIIHPLIIKAEKADAS